MFEVSDSTMDNLVGLAGLDGRTGPTHVRKIAVVWVGSNLYYIKIRTSGMDVI